jgi:hypothetical protein
MNGGTTDDDIWKRPGPPSQTPDTGDGTARYAGPPSTTPPAPGWRPPLIARSAPARRLPIVDDVGIDEAESSARRFTYGLGLMAGAILMVVAVIHTVG